VPERLISLGFRIAFWLPLAGCTWLALMPLPPGPVLEISDVILHGAAFAYLTLAARLAFASQPAWSIALWMIGYGALIEVVQGLGGARMAEWRDLTMDATGILLGLAVHAVIGGPTRRLLERAFGGRLR
jgi:VanZ family protein